jgi:hypothetical protein
MSQAAAVCLERHRQLQSVCNVHVKVCAFVPCLLEEMLVGQTPVQVVHAIVVIIICTCKARAAQAGRDRQAA